MSRVDNLSKKKPEIINELTQKKNTYTKIGQASNVFKTTWAFNNRPDHLLLLTYVGDLV